MQNPAVLPGGVQAPPTKIAKAPPYNKQGGASSPMRAANSLPESVISNGNYATFFIKTLTSSQNVLSASPDRAYLAIQNRGGASIYIGFDEEATTEHLEIPGGGSFTPPVAPVNAIYILGTVINDSITIVQGLR